MEQTYTASLDELEKDLSQIEMEGDLLRRAAYWLTKHIDCTFVLFYAAQKNSPVGQVKYYGEQTKSLVNLPDVVNERVRFAPETKGLLVHSDGALSMPIVYGSLSFGYLFVGKSLNGRRYDAEKMMLLGPVCRIVHNVLVAHEADKAAAEKDKLRDTMNRYMSPEVVDMIAGDDEGKLFRGKKVCASVLYSKTPSNLLLPEDADPTMQLRVLNTYLNEMTQVILSLGGTIGRYDGSSILAFFGATKPLPDHAIRCCLAALRMKRMEGILSEQFSAAHFLKGTLTTNIGINCGEMIAGNIGSLGRMDFSVFGSNVDAAIAIEAASEKCFTSRGILLSPSAYIAVKDCFRTSVSNEANSFAPEKHTPLYELIDVNPDTIPLYTNFLVEEPEPEPKSDGIAEL